VARKVDPADVIKREVEIAIAPPLALHVVILGILVCRVAAESLYEGEDINEKELMSQSGVVSDTVRESLNIVKSGCSRGMTMRNLQFGKQVKCAVHFFNKEASKRLFSPSDHGVLGQIEDRIGASFQEKVP
jgi:hypothetical protein